MEAASSMIGRCCQAKIGKIDSAIRELGALNSQNLFKKNQIFFDLNKRCKKARLQLAVKGALVQPQISNSEKVSSPTILAKQSKLENDIKLFVGLPLDTLSDCNSINHAKAISAGLKALKLLGCEGVELPVWWGTVEKEGIGKYNWSGYLTVAKMVQDLGLKIRVSLCFHGSKDAKIPLPQWVSQIGETDPDVFFMDRSGKRYKECLSLAVDELPILEGKTPMQVYKEFLESFKSTFSPFMGSTITDISIGLGPNGELRYPSFPPKISNQVMGAGEFQCYDKHILNQLKQHAEANGNPLWGLGGPHDAPTYYMAPNSNAFFMDNGGSWESPYGDFFLSWYSNQLIAHGDRILSLACATFEDSPITLSGKVPLVHSWYKMRSHPTEVAAGFYNAGARDGYDAVAEMFARNSCGIVLQGMDLSEKHQPQSLLSSPESLISQIKNACKKHRVKVFGENSELGVLDGHEQIKRNLSGDGVVVNSFTYQRMGAQFFSPEHFPAFTEFIRSLNQPELQVDDLPSNVEEDIIVSSSTTSRPEKDLQMQEA